MGATQIESNGFEDPLAVVSFKSLKVKGLQNVRVVDASIMPNVPSKLKKKNMQIPNTLFIIF